MDSPSRIKWFTISLLKIVDQPRSFYLGHLTWNPMHSFRSCTLQKIGLLRIGYTSFGAVHWTPTKPQSHLIQLAFRVVVEQADRRSEVVYERADLWSEVVVDQCYCFFPKIEYAKLAPPIYVLTILNNVAHMVLGALELAWSLPYLPSPRLLLLY